MLIVVFPKKLLEGLRKRKLADVIVGAMVVYDGPAKLLEAERAGPVDGMQQHRLKKHTTEGIFVVVQQAWKKKCG